MGYAGVKITFSSSALAKTSERLFPESRHRSRRVFKKLVKRFGGEFRMEPAMFKTPFGIVAHPSFRSQLINATRLP